MLNGVLYCCARAASKGKAGPDAAAGSGAAAGSEQQQQQQSASVFASLAAVVVLKLFERALTLQRPRLSELLQGFGGFEVALMTGGARNGAGRDGGDDEVAAAATAMAASVAPTLKHAEDESCEVWAAEEDPDDFCFEDGRGNGGDAAQAADEGSDASRALPARPRAELLERPVLRARLASLSLAVSYDSIAALSVAQWEELHLTASVFRAIRLLLLRPGEGILAEETEEQETAEAEAEAAQERRRGRARRRCSGLGGRASFLCCATACAIGRSALRRCCPPWRTWPDSCCRDSRRASAWP